MWSPDGTRVAYLTTNADGSAGVKVSRLDGSDPSVVIDWREPGLLAPQSWSPDGRHLMMCRVAVPGRPPDLLVWSFETKSLTTFLDTPAFECGAQFSPDGSFVSYVSDEAGPLESWIARFPKATDRRRVATGAAVVSWRADGRELLLLTTKTLDLLAMPLSITRDTVETGPPTVLLKRLDSLWVDAAPDHSRLLVLSGPDPEQGVAEIRLLTGWQEKLR